MSSLLRWTRFNGVGVAGAVVQLAVLSGLTKWLEAQRLLALRATGGRRADRVRVGQFEPECAVHGAARRRSDCEPHRAGIPGADAQESARLPGRDVAGRPG